MIKKVTIFQRLDYTCKENCSLNLASRIAIARSEAEDILDKHIESMPQSLNFDTVKKMLCQVFSPVPTKMHDIT